MLAAILSLLILLVAFFCALGSGTTDHNITAVELCFYGGTLPENTPEEYRVCKAPARNEKEETRSILETIRQFKEAQPAPHKDREGPSHEGR